MPPKKAFQCSILPGGPAVVTERMPAVRTVSLGVWIPAGSRHETRAQEGMAHFWEHMAFKGTAARTARQIALELDLLGGLADAYTSREHTCFSIRVAADHLPVAWDILADIALAPCLPPEEMEREKDVILQEIGMVEDTPDDKLLESLWEAAWDDRAAGHPITGPAEGVAAFFEADLWDWRAANYRPGSMVVAAAGAVDHAALADMIARFFAGLPPAPVGSPETAPVPAFRPGSLSLAREVEQTHVAMAFPVPGNADPGRFARAALCTILGGNMSSRLFQEVREKRGLAYAVGSDLNTMADAGLLEIHAAVDPGRVEELLDVVRRELAAMAAGGVTRQELEHVREHLRGLLLLGAESTENRMVRLAKNHLLFGRHVPLSETAAKIARLSRDEIGQAAAAILDPVRAVVGILGPQIDPAWLEGPTA
ncbi:M16 family metallopeptidase [Desulfolutivibrio sp.]|uniref:M16 family metallopeptidase n=1 Tax=Desulfolutivibrio sp. TaxID=2773296 RepID=UPI002F96D270